MSEIPEDAFARRDGGSWRLMNHLGRKQRRFVRAVRDDAIPLPDLLSKLGVEPRNLTFWMRSRTFRLALGKAMAERCRTCDLEVSMNASTASRKISRLLSHRNAEISRRACETAFQIELYAQEIRTAKRRRAGARRSGEQQRKKLSRGHRMSGPLVGPGSPVHPDLSEEEAQALLAEMEASDGGESIPDPDESPKP